MKAYNKVAILTVFLSVSFSLFSAAQYFNWIRASGGSSFDSASDVIVDKQGNIYLTGSFKDTADFDPGSGVHHLISEGGLDVFIQKLDSSGNLLWAKKVGGLSGDRGNTITVDDNGDVLVVGYFYGFNSPVDFDPGPDTFAISTGASQDVFILKLNSSGEFVWAKKVGSSSGDNSNAVITDKQNNVYVTGVFSGPFSDFDPGTGHFPLPSIGINDVFILKLTASGDFVWAKSVAGDGASISANSIAIDQDKYLYLTGSFRETVDFDPDSGTINLTSSGSGNFNSDLFILKLDTSGAYHWVKKIDGPSSDVGFDIVCDHHGHILIAGDYYSTTDFDPGPDTVLLTADTFLSPKAFVLKLDTSGAFQWAVRIGDDDSSHTRGFSIATDATGNVYVGGAFNSTADFNPGLDTFLLSTDYMDSIKNGGYILKLDTLGNFLWAGAIASDQQSFIGAIAVDTFKNIICTGSFSGNCDFDPDTTIHNQLSVGKSDVFVLRVGKKRDIITTNYVNELRQFSDIKLYPNPSKEYFYLNVDAYNNPTIRIYSVKGELILDSTIINTQIAKIEWNVPPGFYLLEVCDNNNKSIHKLIRH